MNQLRAPDPTLTAFGRRGVLVDCRESSPLVAHGFDGIGQPPPCGDSGSHRLVVADVFAYIAVPCRECFPQAPEPGKTYDHGDGAAIGHPLGDVYLRWQVPSEAVPS